MSKKPSAMDQIRELNASVNRLVANVREALQQRDDAVKDLNRHIIQVNDLRARLHQSESERAVLLAALCERVKKDARPRRSPR